MKTLLVNGCSFTEGSNFNAWPNIVSKQMNTKLVNIAASMNGNSFISKQLINVISQHYTRLGSPGLVVGVMWSKVNRKEILINREETWKWNEITSTVNDNWLHHSVIESKFTYTDQKTFFKNDKEWKDVKSFWMKSGGGYHATKFWADWFKRYYTFEGMFWETLEHILRVQWFLEKYNIPYFMTSIDDLFTEGLSKHEETRHLYDLINMDKFCLYDGTKGIMEHNRENNIPFDHTMHSTAKGHKAFCEDVIIPKVEKYFE